MRIDRARRIKRNDPFLERQKIIAGFLFGFPFLPGVGPFIFAADSQRILIAPGSAVIVIADPQHNRRMVAVFADQITGHSHEPLQVFRPGEITELPRMRQRKAPEVSEFVRGIERSAEIGDRSFLEIVVFADREIEAVLPQTLVNGTRTGF